jgi:hypothetical protein
MAHKRKENTRIFKSICVFVGVGRITFFLSSQTNESSKRVECPVQQTYCIFYIRSKIYFQCMYHQ